MCLCQIVAAFWLYDLLLAGSSAHAMRSGLSGLTLWHSRWGRHSLKKTHTHTAKGRSREKWLCFTLTHQKHKENKVCISDKEILKYDTHTPQKTCSHSSETLSIQGIHFVYVCGCFVHNELQSNDWMNRMLFPPPHTHILLWNKWEQKKKKKTVTICVLCCVRAPMPESTLLIWRSFLPGSLK